MVKVKSISIIKEIDRFGNVRYYNEQNQLHRVDGPTVEYANGDKSYYLHGICHREDGPAIDWIITKEWWYNREFLGSLEGGFTAKKFERWKRLKIFL